MKVAALDAAVAVARALGHPARLRTVAMLQSGELCVCQITEVLGLASSTVSIHLKELRRCGLISERKEGRFVHISLSDGVEAGRWIDIAIAAASSDPQLGEDARKVEDLRGLPVEDLCRLGYEAAKQKAGAAKPACT